MKMQSKLELEKYQYGIDIEKTRQLYGMSGKILYHGRWISRRTDPIIIVEMNEEIAQHEARFYRELNGHDHIIRTLGYIENGLNSTIFIQEYAQRGDLANLIMDNEITMSQILLMEIFVQVTDAMSYVASKSIVHGDLGCRNVLVYRINASNPKNTLVKITDFGLARSLDQPWLTNDNSLVIPVRYCAPEILRDNNPVNYSEKSDVYSMGVFMWEALSNGEMPYSSIDSDEIVRKKKLDDERLIPPPICDRHFWMLMEKCWAFDPSQRITFAQMKEQLSEITISELAEIHRSIFMYQPSIIFKFKLDTDVRMNKELLNGSFGKTYDAQWISREDRPIVLTKMDKSPTDYEFLFYTKLQSHPHIIYTFGFVENDLQSLILLQERALHGNLQLLLEHNLLQPSTEILVEIFSQIIEAMIYIIEQNLVHGDLRCANILVFQMDESNRKGNLVKLTNFSSAHRNDPTIVKDRRSPIPVRYCALEILRIAGQSNYSESSDVYSMGVLMWEACSHGQLPYGSSVLKSEVRQRKLNGEKLVKPWLCDEQIWSIMKDCWHNERESRYNFQEMKIRFSQVNFELEKTYQYEMNVDVQIENQLYGQFGKRFYEAEWIPKTDSSVILLIMNEQTARQEVPFYLQLNSHSHIVHTFGLVKSNFQATVLVQELATHGNLQRLLRNNQFRPSANVLVEIFLQIVDAMIYMINRMVIHGGLCCENVLVFQMNSLKPKENLVKLTNFKLTHRSDQSPMDNRQRAISVRYCAPEILQDNNPLNWSELSDVYSMGVLMWEACSKGDMPYGSDLNDDDVRQRRLNKETLSKPNKCDDQIWTVINYSLHNEPEVRFNFRELQTLLSRICITCSHPEDQYSIDDRSTDNSPVSHTERMEDPAVTLDQDQVSVAATCLSTHNEPEKSDSVESPPTTGSSKSVTGQIGSFFWRMWRKKK